MTHRTPWLAAGAIAALLLFGPSPFASGATMHSITIDGVFTDWAAVPSYFDPVSGPGVLDDGVPDTHDTDHKLPGDVPTYVNHPDIDLVEYKFTHDANNVYAYFRATGEIGNTISNATQHGRYYVIVTIDVDNDDATGYQLCEGGYYPTSNGYDMNMEVEYFDGAFNTGHYLNHGAMDETERDAAEEDQKNGTVRVLPGTYDYYSQWVWFDNDHGDWQLPSPDENASITFVADKGPVYQGIIEIALSPDGREAEMVAPFRGFMRDEADNPIMALGKTIDISFSLEASGELAPGHQWASDTAAPIVGYFLSPIPGDANLDQVVDDTDASILGANWQVQSGATWAMGDFNRDQKVDDKDAAILAANWGPAAEGASVPEPAAVMLLLGALASLLVWRRRG
ncbi:MAG: PEP-CTERM sorting domain-containing protein [Planctomycetia bacterium]|nr:PEP-CTERM sorting domain-containing protein [Planctomycetia bacterium]